jgi:hypothetical protein
MLHGMKGTKILLGISGLIALGVSFGLMFAPQAFLAGQGLVVDDKISVLARAQGSLLFAVGVMNFFGLRVKDKAGLQAICASNIAAHAGGLGVNFYALSNNLTNQSVMGDVIGHVIFGLAFTACFVIVARRAPSAA